MEKITANTSDDSLLINPSRQNPLELKIWQQQVSNKIKSLLTTQSKVVVSIAGGSASGKGQIVDTLLQQLHKDGIPTLIIATDDFYKGISRMIGEKIQNQLQLFHTNHHEIGKIISEVSKNDHFNNKLSPENLQKIAQKIQAAYPSLTKQEVDTILNQIQQAFSELDFDTPEAVDLNYLEEILIAAKQNQEIHLPSYSMKISEPTEKTPTSTKNIQVLLVEGLYALNKKISHLSEIKNFIDLDPRTSLMRRFRRDVLGGRTSFPPEIALWITLEIVLPAYQKHILPNRETADFIVVNPYSPDENFDTNHYEVQDKVEISEDDTRRILEILGPPDTFNQQNDFYLTNADEIFNPDHLIRVRAENGHLKDLVHKGAKTQREDGKTIRPLETYIQEGEFGNKYKNIQELLNAFRKAGFKLATEIRKTRQTFSLQGFKIILDQVEGLGTYLEIQSPNKLSKSPEIENLKVQLGINKNASIGPYADEYFAKINQDPEKSRQQEALLNQGLTAEMILTTASCQVIDQTPEVSTAFQNLRRGYPNRPLGEQCTGQEFRQNADLILQEIAKTTLRNREAAEIVLLMPWRSGLAFGQKYQNLGTKKYYHLSSKRDEETLGTIVDYETGNLSPQDQVIIADPMLATGNTIIDAIKRLVKKGIQPKNIVINAVVAAPIGIQKIKLLYPEIEIIVGALDQKLDGNGYIVPGLGDFGDKYFQNLAPGELFALIDGFNLDEFGRKKIINRIKQQSVGETATLLIQKDLQEMVIDSANRQHLIEKGLNSKKPKKSIKIDTGLVNNVSDVIRIITTNISPSDKIISIEGKAGVGKSATIKALQSQLGGQIFPMGEIFRYLAHQFATNPKLKEALSSTTPPHLAIAKIIKNLSYQIIDGELNLFSAKTNISETLQHEPNDSAFEEKVSAIAAFSQAPVIDFSSREILKLKQQTNTPILIEGRSFTLDFLPVDIRIQLTADPSIRAQRRWGQLFEI